MMYRNLAAWALVLCACSKPSDSQLEFVAAAPASNPASANRASSGGDTTTGIGAVTTPNDASTADAASDGSAGTPNRPVGDAGAVDAGNSGSPAPVDAGNSGSPAPVDAGGAQPVVDAGAAPPPVTPSTNTYNPCPASGKCYLMPVGDSITNGTGSAGVAGYRRPLRALLDPAKLDYDFVGTNDGTAGHHNGISGWKIAQMTEALPEYLTYCSDSNYDRRKPHVFLLMMGTNDVNESSDVARAATHLGALLDVMARQQPAALIVLAQIVPNGDAQLDRSRVVPFNRALVQVAGEHAARGQHVMVVDMHAALTYPGDFADSLHPNDAGYADMARVWYSAVQPLLHPR
jgi:lysophospholipase L1-like esterase